MKIRRGRPYSENRFFAIQFCRFLVLQVLSVIVVLYYVAAGHGTYIPAVILYGSLLIILSPLSSFLSSVPVGMSVVFLVFLLLFLILFKTSSKVLFRYLLTIHIVGAGLLLLINGKSSSSVPFGFEMEGIVISLLIGLFTWYAFFQVVNRSKIQE